MSNYLEDQNKFINFCKLLATQFPEYTLVQEENHWNCYLVNNNDPVKGFFINPERGSKGNKFTVTSRIEKKPYISIDSVYNSSRERVASPTAGFSMDRPIEQLAKGIRTRFLVDFEAYYLLWIALWNSRNDYVNNRENSVKAIGAAMEIKETDLKRSSGGELTCSQYYSQNKALQKNISEVFVSSADSIRITTDYLTKEKAIRLIELLKTL